MDAKELKEILANHLAWLAGKGGKMADLSKADLSKANLWNADLRMANLTGANLWNADLRMADLRRADLRRANLRNADLRRADLRNADLTGANLWNADLTGADLTGADLRRANLRLIYLNSTNIERTILDCQTFKSLSDAVDVAKKLFSENWDAVELSEKYNLFRLHNENRALIGFYADMSGGFCFVGHRKEIWHWNWKCPDPETIIVLWKKDKGA